MTGLLWVNFLFFIIVTAYAVSLFVYLIRTRIEYIQLGKKLNLISG